jgi:hypothetical protein
MKHPQSLDYLEEMALIELSRLERETRIFIQPVRRLASDARDALERAGYITYNIDSTITAYDPVNIDTHQIAIDAAGTVDNDAVLKLIDKREPID